MGAKHGAGKHRPTWKEEREAEARELGYTKPVSYTHLDVYKRQGQGMFGHAIAPQTERRPVDARTEASGPLQNIGGGDPAIRRLQADVARLAPTAIALLLAGETGTGKERLARAIHTRQPGNRPFVTLPCAAWPPDLRAVTDAAEAGTLFVDGPGDLSAADQGRLVQVIAGLDAMPARHRPRPVSYTHLDVYKRQWPP